MKPDLIDAIELGFLSVCWASAAHDSKEESYDLPIKALMKKMDLLDIQIPRGSFDDRMNLINQLSYFLKELGKLKQAKGIRFGAMLALYTPDVGSEGAHDILNLAKDIEVNEQDIETILFRKTHAKKTEGKLLLDWIESLRLKVNIESLPKNDKIFIVHGHDGASKSDLARMIKDEFKLTPVILHEQVSLGATTIMDKFERYAQECSAAIILLTPDDKSIDPDTLRNPQNKRQELLRARQNVVFEMGYFVGKLGKEKVILLHKGNVEIPSDISGASYIPFEKIRDVYLDLREEFEALGLI